MRHSFWRIWADHMQTVNSPQQRTQTDCRSQNDTRINAQVSFLHCARWKRQNIQYQGPCWQIITRDKFMLLDWLKRWPLPRYDQTRQFTLIIIRLNDDTPVSTGCHQRTNIPHPVNCQPTPLSPWLRIKAPLKSFKQGYSQPSCSARLQFSSSLENMACLAFQITKNISFFLKTTSQKIKKQPPFADSSSIAILKLLPRIKFFIKFTSQKHHNQQSKSFHFLKNTLSLTMLNF